MLWASEITNMTGVIEEWLVLCVCHAGHGGVNLSRGAARDERSAEAMRLMRITGKCVFDDIFRGRRKR